MSAPRRSPSPASPTTVVSGGNDVEDWCRNGEVESCLVTAAASYNFFVAAAALAREAAATATTRLLAAPAAAPQLAAPQLTAQGVSPASSNNWRAYAQTLEQQFDERIAAVAADYGAQLSRQRALAAEQVARLESELQYVHEALQTTLSNNTLLMGHVDALEERYDSLVAALHAREE